MPAVLYHNPRCSKSREALALLAARGLDFVVVEYLKSPPDQATILGILAKLDGPPSSLLRTKEEPYAGLGLDETADATQVASAIASHPVLLERPLLVLDDRAGIGRPAERLLELLA